MSSITAPALEGAAASSSHSSWSMSLGSKSFPARRGSGQEGGGGGGGGGGTGGGGERGGSSREDNGKKEPRFDRCFSGPGRLRDMDAGRLKVQIRKWAKAVVSYARQLSFGSPRSRPTTFQAAKSGLGGAREEPPT